MRTFLFTANTKLQRPPHSLWVLLETIILYFLTTVGLRLFKFKKLLFFISQHQSFLTTDNLRLEQIRYYTAILNRLLRKPANCLHNSLVLYWALPKSTLYLGVKHENSAKEAHAWLEWEGRIFTTQVNLNEYVLIYSNQRT